MGESILDHEVQVQAASLRLSGADIARAFCQAVAEAKWSDKWIRALGNTEGGLVLYALVESGDTRLRKV